ncbi:unnamed protein product [Mesocestoides corti]|uniref:Cell division control protein n=1 Tax=Mesocestoides corti TaxID=53468 RepID=A0A0R3U7G9_MESCO|nr:unnamed protein product [Mesocestoides corti]
MKEALIMTLSPPESPKINSVEANGRLLRAVPSRLSHRVLRSPKKVHQATSVQRPRRSSTKPVSSAQANPQNVVQSIQSNHLEIVGRDKEIASLRESLLSWISKKVNGCVYVSGSPGTGKTVTVTQEVQFVANTKGCRPLFLNCMQMASSRSVYTCILEKLGEKSPAAIASAPEKVVAHLETCLIKKSRCLPLIMVLDEIDQLASRFQEVLYTIFWWPEKLSNAHLILIGIANALDLTERLLPCLRLPSHRFVHIVFPPYSTDQIVKIISSRLLTASTTDTKQSLDNPAVQFCAKKVAACSGDVRTALAVCQRALELARLEARSKGGDDIKASEKTPTLTTGLTPLQQRIMSSPSVRNSLKKSNLAPAFVEEPVERFVMPTIRHISQAIREARNGGCIQATSSANHSGVGGGGTHCSGDMPLHHKLVLASLLLLRRLRGLREASVGQVFDVYSHVCSQRGQLAPLDMSEFLSVCELLDSHGLLRLSTSVGQRSSTFSTPTQTKRVALLLDDKSVERNLNDNLLMSSILSIGSLP